MSGIFLGRWWHWGILIAVTAALWFAAPALWPRPSWRRRGA